MDTLDRFSSAQQPAVASLGAVFEAIEGAGLNAAQLLLLAKGDVRMVRLVHDLINDLCVARLGTQLLQNMESSKPVKSSEQTFTQR